MQKTENPIKQTQLANHCPECFSQDTLELSFYQRNFKNILWNYTSNQIFSELRCNKCQTIIYPIRWTKEIELVHDFYLKTVVAKKNIRLYKLGYVEMSFLSFHLEE